MGVVEPPLRLTQVEYLADGTMQYPQHADTAPEDQLAQYLEDAAVVFAAAEARGAAADPPSTRAVSDDFEQLRWFELPAACLQPAG
jgi:hypothetical protein